MGSILATVWGTSQIEGLRAQLHKAEPPVPSLAAADWLAQSFVAPGLAPLYRFLGERGTPLKSHPAQGFDLYHDLVLRHPGGAQELLRAYSRRHGWQVLTRGALRARSARLATAWARQGVAAGKRLALLLPMSPEYVVALLTALRMGLVVCPLPPRGPLLTQQRLAQLAPDFIYTQSLYTPLFGHPLPPPEQLLLDEPPGTAPDDYHASFTYPPGAPVLALLSPLRPPTEQVIEVPSEIVFGGILRDLVLTFGLETGQVLAAPGVWPEQYLPSLVLMTLLGAALYVSLDPEDLPREPKLLSGTALDALITTRALRDLLLSSPPGLLPKPAYLLRDPLESLDLGVWQRLIEAQGWTKVPLGNLIYDSASGGSLLFSARRRGLATCELLPAPGRSYSLLVPDVAARPSPSQQGAFVAAGEKLGFVALARQEDQFLFGGTLTARRDGRHYPEDAALRALTALPFIDGAAVVPVASGDGSGRFLLVFVVLTGAESAARFAEQTAARTEAIHQRLRAQLGDGFQVDQVVLYPLLAPRTKGVVNVERLRADYLTGTLHRKAQTPQITTLHALIAACRNTTLDRLRKTPPANTLQKVPC